MGGSAKSEEAAENGAAQIMLAMILKKLGGSVLLTKDISIEDVLGIETEATDEGFVIKLVTE